MNPANINDWDVSNMTSFNNTFFDAASLNQDLNKWDMSNITTFGALGFRGCTVFNGNVDNWDLSGITSGLGPMWMFCRNFNRDISTKSISAEDSPTGIAYTAWDIGGNPNITSMKDMFYQATSLYGDFNQDITNWDTSNITTMKQMFLNHKSFNQPIGVWNVSSVTNMQYMISNALAFNQNCSAWNLSTSLTNVDRFGFGNSMSDDNWTDTLVGWAVSTYKNSGPYNVSSITNNSVNFIDSKTSDTASGQTYAIKYGSDWTATGWTDSTDARDYLTTATPTGAGWNITR
jgi:surface protein